MRKSNRFWAGLAVLIAVVAGIQLWTAGSANSQEKKSNKTPDARLDLEQSKFMRRKLEASNEILEGLITEDSELVIKGARVLVEMSSAERWQVNHNPIYKQFSADFQQSAKKLVDAAEKENFDAVALKWIDTTLKCMDCHKFVRGAQVAHSVR